MQDQSSSTETAAYSPEGESWHVNNDRYPSCDITVEDENGLAVCTLPRGEGDEDEATLLADAHLLAASPKLLAACRQVNAVFEAWNRGEKPSPSHIDAWRSVRDALALAEGR